MYSVKIKTKNGTQHIIRYAIRFRHDRKSNYFSLYSDLSDETKISKLKTQIQELTNLKPPIEIRFGFPPKISSAQDDDTLKSSGISSGGEFEYLCNLTRKEFFSS